MLRYHTDFIAPLNALQEKALHIGMDSGLVEGGAKKC